LLGELNCEWWCEDATVIHAKRVRKQKTDRQDAHLILKLILKDNFPQIWVPSGENRDPRRLWYRHRMVQARTLRPSLTVRALSRFAEDLLGAAE
jgi:transposase